MLLRLLIYMLHISYDLYQQNIDYRTNVMLQILSKKQVSNAMWNTNEKEVSSLERKKKIYIQI